MFHNLSGYDAHLFIRELGGHASDMEVITKNKEDYISFSINGQNQFKVPFIMCADFESILEPMGSQGSGSPNPNQPYTNEVNQHTPSGWCIYSKFAYGDVDNPLRLYRGKDYIETFL